MMQNRPTKRGKACKGVGGLKQKRVLIQSSRGAQNMTLYSL